MSADTAKMIPAMTQRLHQILRDHAFGYFELRGDVRVRKSIATAQQKRIPRLGRQLRKRQGKLAKLIPVDREGFGRRGTVRNRLQHGFIAD